MTESKCCLAVALFAAAWSYLMFLVATRLLPLMF